MRNELQRREEERIAAFEELTPAEQWSLALDEWERQQRVAKIRELTEWLRDDSGVRGSNGA